MTPGGSKSCTIASTRSTSARRSPQHFGDRFNVAGEISPVVDHADEIGADQPVGRVVHWRD